MDKYSILKDYFGYDSFRDGQEDIINSLIQKRDVLCVMPTGAGKSMCYQIPAMLADGITIVISPLISLMKDQVNSLTSAGIRAAYINSSLTFRQYLKVLENIKNNTYKIIYVAPERLATEDFTEICRQCDISLIAVDEAHCISQWGQDFRPSYLKISDFVKCLPKRPVIGAFTATATKEVKEDIAEILSLKDPFKITTGFDRPNLYFEVRETSAKRKNDILLSILQDRHGQSGIVYCATRKNVEAVTQMLRDNNISATRYHAGLTEEERIKNQDSFVYDKIPVMVATNAFGMGIDKSNVSFVIHYNMPKNIESYYQEAGRAGRDGSDADCIMLYSATDVRLNRFLIENSEPNRDMTPEEYEKIRQRDYDRLKYMTWYCTSSDCLRNYILKYFGEKSAEFCNNCSNCHSGFERTDITIDSQKILSCIARLKYSFGISVICDILRGSKSEKIKSRGFDKLSTYGILSDRSERYLRSEINELIVMGYIESTDGDYPVLHLTKKAENVLFGKEKVYLTVPKTKAEPMKTITIVSATEANDLFEALKELRMHIANEKKVPAYVIFSNSTLLDMSIKRPRTAEEFLNINGVGKAKMQLYGEEFLSLINTFCSL